MSVAGESGSDANRNISVAKFQAPKIEGEKSSKKVPKVKMDPMPTETFHGREIFLYSQAKV